MPDLLGRAYGAYQFYKEREKELEKHSKIKGGRLQRQDVWLKEYYNSPYLLLANDAEIEDRFADILVNHWYLTNEGQFAFLSEDAINRRFLRMFSEVIQETNWRGLLQPNFARAAKDQLQAYHRDGLPIGCQMFGKRNRISPNTLVKFSDARYISEMSKFGRFRISPASEYGKNNYIKAIKDFERVRSFKIGALNEWLKGNRSIFVQGNEMEIKNGSIAVQIIVDDYYLFSTCEEIDRRMPTDFASNGAFIIKNKAEFIRRLEVALLAENPSFKFFEDPVYYYDPYIDIPNQQNLQFWKPIGFSYQKEHRCVLQPPYGQIGELRPFFVELGSLEDISEIVLA